jgi:hypothetical protein
MSLFAAGESAAKIGFGVSIVFFLSLILSVDPRGHNKRRHDVDQCLLSTLCAIHSVSDGFYIILKLTAFRFIRDKKVFI